MGSPLAPKFSLIPYRQVIANNIRINNRIDRYQGIESKAPYAVYGVHYRRSFLLRMLSKVNSCLQSFLRQNYG